MTKTKVAVAALLLSGVSVAQVGPPSKHDGSLEQRYANLRCALLLIRTTDGYGTGFFVSADGDVATASHVVGHRTFTTLQNGTMQVDLSLVPTFDVTDDSGKTTTIPADRVEKNGDAWGADETLIKTGIQTHCWLKSADDEPKPGEHVITLGFPGVAFGSLALYTGIMSAKLKPDSIVGFNNLGQPVKQENEVIRVQMPISPGLSGSPLIDDMNRVIGIVTEAGFSTPRLNFLLEANRQHAFDALVPAPAPTPSRPGETQVTINIFSIVAELVENLREFASPGYGDAAPIGYLRKEQLQHQQRAKSGR